MSDPTTRPLTDSDLSHEGVGYDSGAMRRLLSVPGADRLPGGMAADEAFAIDPAGESYDLGDVIPTPGENIGDEQGLMSDRELVEALEREERDAIEWTNSSVAQQRADALDYYFGREFGNEDDDHSSAVQTEVFDAVETTLPVILKPFISSDEVVVFNPTGPEDVQAAEQETGYINHVLMERNDGFGVIRRWVWDALVQKNGVVKYWWEPAEAPTVESFAGITQDVLHLLLMSDEVEIIEGREYPAVQAMPAAQFMGGMQPPMLYDVKVRRRKGKGRACVANIPPEEFIVSRDATDPNPKKARFVGHRSLKTISEIRAMGIDIPDDFSAGGVAGDLADIESAPEFLARHENDAAQGGTLQDGEGAMRRLLVRELYPCIDFDGDGYAERRKVVLIGSDVFVNEEVEEPPFSGWACYPIAHSYYGVSVADLAMDFQLQASTVVRQTLDNIYGINSNRVAISQAVNWDDLLTNVVGGYVRVKDKQVSGHIEPLAPQSIIQYTLPVLQYMNQQKENRLGYSRGSKGMSANSLSRDPVTATEADLASQQSDERTQLMARTFAETGLKDLMVSLHGLVRRNSSAPDTFRRENKWVTVDPRFWADRRDMSVSVGLGTNDRSKQIAFWQAVLALQQQAMQLGLTSPAELYNTAKRFLNAGGEKNVELFFKDPTQAQPPPPSKPESVQVQEVANQGLIQMEQVKAQASLQKAQMDNETKERIELRKAGVDLVTSGTKLEQDDAKLAHDRQRSEHDQGMARANFMKPPAPKGMQ